MKQYFLKLSAASLLLGLMAVSASAQQEESDMKTRKKTERSDLIIVKTNDGKDAKVTIEIKDGEVKVNGKPLSEFKDDNVTITKRKTVEGNVIFAPNSRFRSGGGTMTYNSDEMALLNRMGETRPFLGVTTEKEGDGARITDISDGSAAEKAGLKEGDIIIRINDQKVNSPEDLTKAIHKYKPEEKVTVVFKREGKEQSQSIALGKRTESNLTFAPGEFNMDKVFTQPGQGYSYSFGPPRSKLGIKAQETEDGKGLKVLNVDDESPAEKAGIKEDDIITEFDGAEVNNVDKLRELAAVAATKVSFKVKLIRDGKTEEVQVKIPKNLKTANL